MVPFVECETIRTYFLDVVVENATEITLDALPNNRPDYYHYKNKLSDFNYLQCPTVSMETKFRNRQYKNQPHLEKLWSKPGGFMLQKDVTEQCGGPIKEQEATVIDTMEVYKNFDFQQNFNSQSLFWSNFLEERFRKQFCDPNTFPLKVFIVPFSHNDAGWVRTFREYYDEKTKYIFNKIVEKLQRYDDMTFVWSEISFLAEWWKSTDMQTRSDFLELIREGRLEILTGGWVMPDEAITHYYALVNQLIEGHQWIKNNLGIIPKTGWSIDPFGQSATLPYLLHVSGIRDGTMIQRVHYKWKEYFAKNKYGDFLWRQRWDSNGNNDVMTHHKPYEIYSAVRSCGPHRLVCQEYDFYLKSNNNCSNKITFKNVKERLEIILSEYGRTGSLFEHNVVLVSLGDDFRYVEDIEWTEQYTNYKALIDYLSSVKDIYNNAEIKFGTVLDYFKEVKLRKSKLKFNFPIIKGDFFPYVDLDKTGPSYWTGFYSTRPYWKTFDRKVEANLRSAEILYTMALNYMRQNNIQHKPLLGLYKKLIKSRQMLSVFQHHDGITGTSKHRVMSNYLTMLIESNINLLSIQSRTIQNLLFDLNTNNCKFKKNMIPTLLVPTTLFTQMNNNPLNIEIKIIDRYPRSIIIFNPLASWREDVVRLIISNPFVIIKDAKNNRVVSHQINPLWCISTDESGNQTIMRLNVSNKKYELIFDVQIEPLTLKVYTIEIEKNFDEINECDKAIILTTCNLEYDNRKHDDVFKHMINNNETVSLENNDIILKIDLTTGSLKEIINKLDNSRILLSHFFKMYKSTRQKSGAYLFQPLTDEDPQLIFKNVYVILIMGKITKELIIVYDQMITNIIKLYNTDGPLSKIVHIEQIIDIKKSSSSLNINIELCNQFKTNIDSGDPSTFHTDSNGYQMQKRETVQRLGVEGNYYPITSSIYIEDDKNRFSILTKQSHGGTSINKGTIEIMLDRRIEEDDQKGMGEGVLDNEMTTFNFWLLLEKPDNNNNNDDNDKSKSTLLSEYLSDNLIYPVNVFVSNMFMDPSYFNNEQNLISNGLPCGVHLINMRTLTHNSINNYPLGTALITIFRKGSSARNLNQLNNSKMAKLIRCEPFTVRSQVFSSKTCFGNLTINSIKKVTLTGLIENSTLSTLSEFNLKQFESGSLEINFT